MKEADKILLAQEWERRVSVVGMPNSAYALLNWLDDRDLLNGDNFRRNPCKIGNVVFYQNQEYDVVEAPNKVIKGLNGEEHFPITLSTKEGVHINTVTDTVELKVGV